ncbi:MAG: acyl-CoA mutase large subunit family protein [Alistipes sp.]|nr:acyl-CoA mutase large subunit family protein [Candidatus Alistipes equi]
MANREKLFAEFPQVSTEDWEAAIAVDLKGADYERKLVWRTNEGFNVRPYYRAENLAGIKGLGTQAGEFPYIRGVKADNNWLTLQTIEVSCPVEANLEAKKLLSSGVDSIGFCITNEEFSAENVEALLLGIDLAKTEVVFSGKHVACVAEKVLALLEKTGVSKDDAKLCFELDPIVSHLSKNGQWCDKCGGEKCFEKIASLVRLADGYKHVRFVNVAGNLFADSGSTIVEELAFSLSAAHEYLVRLMNAGLTIDQAAKSIRFTFAVTSTYFMEIAKFRAARMLWANIVSAYEPKCPCAQKMFAHARTSAWNQTVYDPYVNMLRGTTEAMSAAIAGVHSLEVLPFDHAYEAPTEFSNRIARNESLLLKHEAHFDQVVDPAGGSYYIENLTASIANEAWKLFLDLEDKGGYVEAFLSGVVVEKVKASAAAKDKAVATRRQSILGANQFPNFTETADAAIKACAVERESQEGNKLTPYRGAMAFEKMRLNVDRGEKTPKAFMLTCGSLAMARARAQFSCNFFACAGIRVVDNTFFKSVEDGVKAALDSKAEIIVICSSDDDYATLAPQINEMIAGKAIVVVAGAPACMEELQQKGIKNFISIKSNVLETLQSYLTQMGI